MDILPESIGRRPDRRRQGIALPTALFALLMVSILSVGMWTMVQVNAMSASNRKDATVALSLADGAATHTLAVLAGELDTISLTRLLLGSDSTVATADDGLLIDYGLAVTDQIPDTGYVMPGGRYFVELLDDPADDDTDPLADSNLRILARCTGVTLNGGSATVDIVIGAASFPAIATDGDLYLNGNPDILGACGGAHANNVVIVSGTPTVQTEVSAADSVEVSGDIVDPDDNSVPPVNNAPAIVIPDLDPLDYCDVADFILYANGYFVTVEPSRDSVDATSTPKNGWTRGSSSPVEWNLSGNSAVAGTHCIYGNVVVSGNPGPIAMTLLATGSVTYSGNPRVTSSHPDGILIISGGDVEVSGNPGGGAISYDGLIYAQSQCMINGNPNLYAQLLCNDEPETAGANNNVDQNGISGNPVITYNCGGMLAGERRILHWYQVLGG